MVARAEAKLKKKKKTKLLAATASGEPPAAELDVPPPAENAREPPQAGAKTSKRKRQPPVAELDVPPPAGNARDPPPAAATTSKRKGKSSESDVPAGAVTEVSEDTRGVIHLATVPMCMTAEKVRHLMEEYGEVGRVFLQAEDKVTHSNRKKTGGNRKGRFVEGWIEFADKRIAKRVALALNGHAIGGRKRFYRDDMWNMRYLSKFKWYQLKEGAIYQHQVRKARLEQKVSQARRENEFFMEKLQQAKTQRKIEEKRASKGARSGDKRGADGEARFPAAKRGAGFERPMGMAPRIPDISDSVLSSLL